MEFMKFGDRIPKVAEEVTLPSREGRGGWLAAELGLVSEGGYELACPLPASPEGRSRWSFSSWMIRRHGGAELTRNHHIAEEQFRTALAEPVAEAALTLDD